MWDLIQQFELATAIGISFAVVIIFLSKQFFTADLPPPRKYFREFVIEGCVAVVLYAGNYLTNFTEKAMQTVNAYIGVIIVASVFTLAYAFIVQVNAIRREMCLRVRDAVGELLMRILAWFIRGILLMDDMPKDMHSFILGRLFLWLSIGMVVALYGGLALDLKLPTTSGQIPLFLGVMIVVIFACGWTSHLVGKVVVSKTAKLRTWFSAILKRI